MPYKPTGRPPGRPRKRAPQPDEQGEQPSLSGAKWRALAREYAGLNWKRVADVNDTRWPSETPAARVAQYAGVSRRVIYKWRNDPWYAQGLIWLMSNELLSNIMNNHDEESALKSENNRGALLHKYVKDNWDGPTTSPIDGEIYYTIEDYVDHLIEEGVWPADDIESKIRNR